MLHNYLTYKNPPLGVHSMKLLARHYRIWQFLKWHLPFMVIFHVNLPKKVSQYIENAIFGGSLRSPLYEILIREILICEVSL